MTDNTLVGQQNHLPLAITSAPERIWLDLGVNPCEEDAHFSNLHDLTWSQDNATGDGIEYVRADRAAREVAQAAPVEAQHSTACLYHYALSRLGLRDNTGLRVLFWDAHNSLSWDSKTDWYVTPDADEADCGLCNAARAAQEGKYD